MNQAAYNLVKTLCGLFLSIQLFIWLYLIATSANRLILFRQDESLSVDDRRNINFTKYLVIQITVMMILHTIFYIYALYKNRSIGILMMVISFVIQILAKLTMKKVFMDEELFVALFVLDFLIIFSSLSVIPRQTKGFKFKMLFRNTMFI